MTSQLTPREENIVGTALSGTSGFNRTYTLAYSNYQSSSGISIISQGVPLMYGASLDFSVSGQVVTFNVYVDDSFNLNIQYFTTDAYVPLTAPVSTTKQDIIRAKLANKLFSSNAGLAVSVTLKSKSSPIYNTRGGLESVTDTSTTIAVVPYEMIGTKRDLEQFGELKEGQLMMAVPYNVTIAVRDEITMYAETYTVEEVHPNYLPGNVVTLIKVSRNTV